MAASTVQSFTASAAKNHLGVLLDRVAAGEELIITLHGRPVAKLVPINNRAESEIDLALTAFRAVRHSLRKAGRRISRRQIRSWKHAGRR